MMATAKGALRFLDGRVQDVRFWYRRAYARRLVRSLPPELRPLEHGQHPARAHIHAPRSIGDVATDIIAAFAGSWLFFALSTLWFVLWFVLRLDINLLTLIVSLEAIYLANFLLMNQNRQGAKDRVRDDTEAEEVETLTSMNQQQLLILEKQNESMAQQSEILALLRDGTTKPIAASGQPLGQPVVVKPPQASQGSQASQTPPMTQPRGPLTRRQQAIKKP